MKAAQPIYNVPNHGKMPTKRLPYRDENGLPIIEKVTKQVYRAMLNPMGNIVRVTLGNGPAVRQIKEYGTNKARWKERDGFYFADECPLDSGKIRRKEAEAMFDAEDQDPCEGRFSDIVHCKHIMALQDKRQKLNTSKQAAVANDHKSLDQFLREHFVNQKAEEIAAATAAKPKKATKK